MQYCWFKKKKKIIWLPYCSESCMEWVSCSERQFYIFRSQMLTRSWVVYDWAVTDSDHASFCSRINFNCVVSGLVLAHSFSSGLSSFCLGVMTITAFLHSCLLNNWGCRELLMFPPLIGNRKATWLKQRCQNIQTETGVEPPVFICSMSRNQPSKYDCCLLLLLLLAHKRYTIGDVSSICMAFILHIITMP